MSNRLARIGVVTGVTVVAGLVVYGAVLAIYWYITGPVPHMTLFFARRLSYSLWALGFLAILASSDDQLVFFTPPHLA